MECSIKEQKIQAMKKYKRAKFVYNFVLYSLTSLITCFFFSYPLWFPSMKHYLSSPAINISSFLNAKCLFLVGNLIIFILVGESKLKQSSSSSSLDIYDEYVARSRNSNRRVMSKEAEGLEKRSNMEEKGYGEERKKELRVARSSIPHDEEKRKGLRSCKSEVWGESKIHVKRREKTKGKKDVSISQEKEEMGMRSCKSEIWGESAILMGANPKRQKDLEEMNHEEKAIGMRSCKSAVWGEDEIVQKNEGQKEKESGKCSTNDEEKKMGMRSCKSAVWGKNEVVQRIEGQKEEEICKSSMKNEEKTTGLMRNCKSAVWGENDSMGQKEEEIGKSNMDDEEKKMGMRGCKSAVWGETEISEKYKGKKKEEQTMTTEDLNNRVEAFIARINKQRLLESKLVYDRG